VTATDDAAALIDMRPDCVVYAAAGPERDGAAIPDYVRLLQSGINVVTTTVNRLIHPPTFQPQGWCDQLTEAALAGGASLYASGIEPGFAADHLVLMLATQSKTIRSIRATEVALHDDYPVVDTMMNAMGFGQPLDFAPMLATPGAIGFQWGPGLHVIADGLGLEIDEVRERFDRVPTDRDLEVAFGTAKAGTCGALRTQAIAVVDGREERIRSTACASKASPTSPATCRQPWSNPRHPVANMTSGAGAMISTAMRVVNAIRTWWTPSPACYRRWTSHLRFRGTHFVDNVIHRRVDCAVPDHETAQNASASSPASYSARSGSASRQTVDGSRPSSPGGQHTCERDYIS
jgi:hypothetical protein